MPKLEFTPEELSRYFGGDVNNWHCYYDKSVKMAAEMAVHANGEYPCDLLDSRRPNEPQEVMDYRKCIFVPKTKPYFSKVLGSLSKIRRSSDWSIRYEGEFNKIPEGETLEDYCEYYYPGFTSITNWVFSVMLKKYLIDSNAVMFVYPQNLDQIIVGNELLQPIAEIYESCHVVDYVPEDYAVLINPQGCVYKKGNVDVAGKSFFIITTQAIQRYDQIDEKMNFSLELNYPHGLELLPVYKIGGVISCTHGTNYLYESRIAGVLPEFNEAIREYSDLQAAKVLHIYPERWEYTQHECPDCKGTGRRRNPVWHEGCDSSVSCDVPCDNKACYNGYTVAGPYSKIMIRPLSPMEGGGATNMPTPPAGYVAKDIEIVKVQEEGVERHIYNALAAINFEFLMNVPLNQSGVAKEVDRDELNNTVHSIAEDVVRNMDWLYWVIAKYRYRMQYSDAELENMIPSVAVPEKFDILSSKHLEETLKAAKDSKTNPVIINALEVEYANKEFNSDPEVLNVVELVLKLDPLSNIAEEDKMVRLTNKGITQLTYVVSSNIQEFVERAMVEETNFEEMDLPKQKEIMAKYAQEILDAQAAEMVELAEEEDFNQPEGEEEEVEEPIIPEGGNPEANN